MHIGLIPEQSASTGGSYIYSRFLLDAALQAIRRDQDHQAWVFIDKAGEVFRHLADAEFRQAAWLDPPGERLKRVLQQTPYLKPARMAYHGLRRIAGSPAARRIDPEKPRYASTRHRRLRQLGIEAAIYTYPTSSAFENQIPYVMPIHDLQHRLQPQFPEVSAGREWEHREYLYRNAIRFGTTILADSQVGKEDILNCYPEYASPECIEVLPYPPIQTLAVDDVESERERVRGAFGLPERFFFYPAQFWPHKNHLRIVQALALIRDRHRVAIELVLSGTHSGKLRTLTFQEVMTEAHRLGVDEQVKYLGYVADRDVAALYVTAQGLVMPTFFGPTNIPILEAWAAGCPVLTSDIRGVREQAGDAALLADPTSVEEIAEGMYRLWTDGQLRGTLMSKGRERVKHFSAEKFMERVSEILAGTFERWTGEGKRIWKIA